MGAKAELREALATIAERDVKIRRLEEEVEALRKMIQVVARGGVQAVL